MDTSRRELLTSVPSGSLLPAAPQDTTGIQKKIVRHKRGRPDDLIFRGTPGSTRKMEQGDTVEVDIEGIGILRNKAAQAAAS